MRAEAGKRKCIKFSIASLKTEIRCPYGNSFYDFIDYRASFERPDVIIRLSQEDLDLERLQHHPDFVEPDITVDCEKVCVTYDLGFLEPFVALHRFADALPPFQSFLMHGAVVALDGQAYMFTAPSGVGKTTRTRLWLEEYPSSIVVNGDKPVIQLREDGVYACGTPWAGKEGWNTNTMLPLRAIFLLERASTDSVEEISLGKAFPTILQQSHRPADVDSMRKTLALIQALEGKVKFYRFHSTPTREAVRLAYETARP